MTLIPNRSAKISSAIPFEQPRIETTMAFNVTIVGETMPVLLQGRETLVQLLETPNLGTLRIDVNQTLEELEDLLDDLKQTFPEAF